MKQIYLLSTKSKFQIRSMVKKFYTIVTLPLKMVCYILIYLYKMFISPLLPKSCRYIPSCSSYGLEAIKKHGVIVGIFLAGNRILHCTSKFDGGYDPVPQNIKGEMKWLI